MKCNGCGREFPGRLTYGTLSFGLLDLHTASVSAQHHKTLCPRCQHVMKDILLSSDLSEQWDSYDWSLMSEPFTEPYDDG